VGGCFSFISGQPTVFCDICGPEMKDEDRVIMVAFGALVQA
jgi:rRNA maturation endonuclease Nob1